MTGTLKGCHVYENRTRKTKLTSSGCNKKKYCMPGAEDGREKVHENLKSWGWARSRCEVQMYTNCVAQDPQGKE